MKTTLYIQNLKCGGCEHTITSALSKIGGIKHPTVHLDDASITFHFEVAAQLETVREILANLGYPVIGDPNSLGKRAKSYLSCAKGKMATD